MVTFLAIAAIIVLVFRGRLRVAAPGVKQISSELKTQAARHHLSLKTVLLRKYWGLVIDDKKAMLLYVVYKAGRMNTILFDISQAVNCDILKTYTTSRQFFFSRSKPKKYIDSIMLSIRHIDRNSSLHLVFYNHPKDNLSEMKMLFQKARHWQRMIQTILVSQSSPSIAYSDSRIDKIKDKNVFNQ